MKFEISERNDIVTELNLEVNSVNFFMNKQVI
jgi:hypothetical protein